MERAENAKKFLKAHFKSIARDAAGALLFAAAGYEGGLAIQDAVNANAWKTAGLLALGPVFGGSVGDGFLEAMIPKTVAVAAFAALGLMAIRRK